MIDAIMPVSVRQRGMTCSQVGGGPPLRYRSKSEKTSSEKLSALVGSESVAGIVAGGQPALRQKTPVQSIVVSGSEMPRSLRKSSTARRHSSKHP